MNTRANIIVTRLSTRQLIIIDFILTLFIKNFNDDSTKKVSTDEFRIDKVSEEEEEEEGSNLLVNFSSSGSSKIFGRTRRRRIL